MKHAPVRHRLEYGTYLAFKGIIRALPHAAARPLGAFLGGLACRLDRRHRDVAAANLALAFPTLAAAERRRLVTACFRHFGAALFDLISSERFDAVELCRRFRYEGWEHLDRAERLGRGVFLLGAHHAYWEISGRPIGLYRGVIHTVARPADNPHLDRELSRLRRGLGYAVISKRGAARRMLQVVRSGGRVGILPDQRVQEREGILVPFFGHPALTTPVLARLALRDGCPVVPVFAYPEPGGRYRLVIRPPILPEEAAASGAASDGSGRAEPNDDAGADEAAASETAASETAASETGANESAAGKAAASEAPANDEAKVGSQDAATAVAMLTRRYLEAIEREIRDHPEMWLWMHRRWDRPQRGSRSIDQPESS